MPTLIACLSSGKGTWTEVTRIMQSQPWDKIFLITNQFGKDNFTSPLPNISLLVVDQFHATSSLTEYIKKQLQDKITDFDVALNLASGTGKEHMAVLEAVLELGLNFRLVTLNGSQYEVLGIKP